ncbi:hypothetical protein HYW30_01355 [Candidatus Azambacteria bacterium]|nr:hypothetical protein [Candidatus Azambacteria bacterium]
MLKNHNHNLIQQLSEDLDSLWRYEQYTTDAAACSHCTELWKKLRELDEEKVKLLRDEITRHVNEGVFE